MLRNLDGLVSADVVIYRPRMFSHPGNILVGRWQAARLMNELCMNQPLSTKKNIVLYIEKEIKRFKREASIHSIITILDEEKRNA